MSDANVIEVWGESVALALEVEGGFRFVAATPRVAALDGNFYPTFGHARLAAIQQSRSFSERTGGLSAGRLGIVPGNNIHCKNCKTPANQRSAY